MVSFFIGTGISLTVMDTKKQKQIHLDNFELSKIQTV